MNSAVTVALMRSLYRELASLAPHQCPAGILEILGDVALAPVPAAPLSRHSRLALAPRPHPTVEDHVPGASAEYMFEIRVLCRYRTQDDDQQVDHELPFDAGA